MTTQTTSQAPQTVHAQHEQEQPLKIHRRKTRRHIWLPVLLGVVLIVGVVLVALSLGRSSTSGIADIMLSFLCLLPLIICLFPLYLILVVSVVLLARVKPTINRGLETARKKTEGFESQSEQTMMKAARKVANWNIRLAPLDVLFGVFERYNANDNRTGKK